MAGIGSDRNSISDTEGRKTAQPTVRHAVKSNNPTFMKIPFFPGDWFNLFTGENNEAKTGLQEIILCINNPKRKEKK
jgi:hypothetical protein